MSSSRVCWSMNRFMRARRHVDGVVPGHLAGGVGLVGLFVNVTDDGLHDEHRHEQGEAG